MAENQPVTKSEWMEAVQTYATAKNQRDLETAMAVWHEQGEFQLVPLDLNIVGREEVRTFFDRFLDAVDEYEGKIEAIDAGEDLVTVQWRLTGVVTGELLGVSPTNEHIDLPVVSLFILENGLIRSERMYADLASLSSQADIDLSVLTGLTDAAADADPQEFLSRFTEMWKDPTPQEFADLFSEDGELLHPTMDEPIARDEIPEYVAQITSVSPDISLSVDRWAARGNSVFIEWTITGSYADEQIRWRGADRFTLQGDRATEGVAYFDTLPLWEQIGADPSSEEIVDAAQDANQGREA